MRSSAEQAILDAGYDPTPHDPGNCLLEALGEICETCTPFLGPTRDDLELEEMRAYFEAHPVERIG